MEKLMSVGEVLKTLGITHSTLRDWDRKEILPARRNVFGWRLYRPKDVDRVKLKIIFGRRDGKKMLLHAVTENGPHRLTRIKQKRS